MTKRAWRRLGRIIGQVFFWGFILVSFGLIASVIVFPYVSLIRMETSELTRGLTYGIAKAYLLRWTERENFSYATIEELFVNIEPSAQTWIKHYPKDVDGDFMDAWENKILISWEISDGGEFNVSALSAGWDERYGTKDDIIWSCNSSGR